MLLGLGMRHECPDAVPADRLSYLAADGTPDSVSYSAFGSDRIPDDTTDRVSYSSRPDHGADHAADRGSYSRRPTMW
jgi:hypothetical protein